jgi:hypothetical protein
MICLPTANPLRWYVPRLETNFIVQPPIETNDRLSLRTNAVLLQNQGNCDVVLDMGFTIEPGQSLMLGNYGELNVLKFDTQVQFDLSTVPDGEADILRLEVIEIRTHVAGDGFYIDQPALRYKQQ